MRSFFPALLLLTALTLTATAQADPTRGYSQSQFQRKYQEFERKLEGYRAVEAWVNRLGSLDQETDRARLARLEDEAVQHVRTLREVLDEALDLAVGMKSTSDLYLIQESVEQDEVFRKTVADLTKGLFSLSTVLGMVRVRRAAIGN